MKDVAVFYVLDPSPDNHIAREALLSSKTLRTYGGKYKNTKIYYLIPSAKEHDTTFVKTLMELGRIENTHQIRLTDLLSLEDSISTDGFIAKSAGMSWASEHLKHEYMLYVDCDTIFLKEPPFDELKDRVYLHRQTEPDYKYWDHLETLIKYSHKMYNLLANPSIYYRHTFGWFMYARGDSPAWSDYYNEYRRMLNKFPEVENELLSYTDMLDFLGALKGQEANFVRGLIDEIALTMLAIRYDSLLIQDVAQEFGITNQTWVFHFDDIPSAMNELKNLGKEGFVT